MPLNIKVRPIFKESSNYPLLNVLAISWGKKRKEKKRKKRKYLWIDPVILSFRGGIWYAGNELWPRSATEINTKKVLPWL